MRRFVPLKLLSPAEMAAQERATRTRVVSQDRGRLRTAKEISADVLHGSLNARWVVARMGPAIGFKPGRQWLFYENDAREWWEEFLERSAGRLPDPAAGA